MQPFLVCAYIRTRYQINSQPASYAIKYSNNGQESDLRIAAYLKEQLKFYSLILTHRKHLGKIYTDITIRIIRTYRLRLQFFSIIVPYKKTINKKQCEIASLRRAWFEERETI